MHARLNAVRLILAALISPGLIVGCANDNPGASPQPTTTDPTPSASETLSGIGVVSEDDADLVLHVSNQSFADDTVHVTVSVDDVEVIDADFAVEGQHNWITFPLELPGGEHEIVAVSDTGVEFATTFNSSTFKPKYAVLDYWDYEDAEGKHFTWHIQSTPLAFD